MTANRADVRDFLITRRVGSCRAEKGAAASTETCDTYQQAAIHRGLAESHDSEGGHEQARHHWQHALALHTEADEPEAAEIRSRLSVPQIEQAGP